MFSRRKGSGMTRAHRNISFATVESFDAVLRDGADVTVRGLQTKELRNRVTRISRPTERCVFLPGRRNDVFAQVAEAMWVIAGREDVPWLALYVPRAPEFSDDDGMTWRGAYGPRLRAWIGDVDQVAEWRRLLLDDRDSRRVVGVLFDPTRDFLTDSKDIPCNNWLSWLIRGDRLHLNVAIRSNDAMWGFSGVNAFEWSVLQEMMAFWVGAEVGDATYFATSYHLYSMHYARAQRVIDRFYGVTPYDFGILPPKFTTSWEQFPATISDWFEAEEGVRTDPDSPPQEGAASRDPFFASTIRLLRLKWGSAGWSAARLENELSALPEDDFAVAAYEFFGRDKPDLLTNISQPNIAAFFRACAAAMKDGSADLKEAIEHLHARKNASYAGSWKRRGERVSVLPNIARKVDRLLAFVEDEKVMEGETILDTTIDLYVYATKYRLFLAEFPDADISPLNGAAPRPFSDHDENFDMLVEAADFSEKQGSFADQVRSLGVKFEDLWQAADKGAGLSERQDRAADFMSAAESLVPLVAAMEQRALGEFLRQERRT